MLRCFEQPAHYEHAILLATTTPFIIITETTLEDDALAYIVGLV
jgi:hypothetical protein